MEIVRIKCSLCPEAAAIRRPKSSQTRAARKNATISKTTNRNLSDISFRQSVNKLENRFFFQLGFIECEIRYSARLAAIRIIEVS